MTAAKLPPGIDRKRPGIIRARYRCDGCAKHPVSGQHSKTFPERGGIRAAQQWLREQRVAVTDGTHVSAGAVMFRDYAAERIATWRKHKATTRVQVESHVRNHLLPTFGDMPVGSIRTAHVEAWVARTEQVIAPSTLHVVHAWLNRIMADAVRERLLRENPCTGVELPEVVKPEIQPLPLDAVDALAAALPPHLRATVLVSAWAGLRQGEVLGLRVHRLDLLGRHDDRGRRQPPSIYVAEQLQTLPKGAPMLVAPKTKRSVRRVPIPGVLVDVLAAHLAEHPAGPDGYVFTNTAGRPLRRNLFGESWRRAVADAGLPKGTRFHDLRHTYASMLIEAGESVTVVSKRLGHASPVETLETYSHLWPDSDEHTVAVLDAAFARHAADCVPDVSRAGSVTAFPQVRR